MGRCSDEGRLGSVPDDIQNGQKIGYFRAVDIGNDGGMPSDRQASRGHRYGWSVVTSNRGEPAQAKGGGHIRQIH